MKVLVEEMPDEGYGCSVANRFGQLLDDESDPFDLLQAAEVDKKPKKKKEEPKKPAATTKAAKKESQRDRKVIVSSVSGGRGHIRPSRGEVEEQVEKRVTFERKWNDPEASLSFSVERPVDEVNKPIRGRGSGRGRGGRGQGHPRNNDGFDQRGKREFERHSGSDRTSVRSEEKRGGSGSRNWGSVRDQISEIEEGSPSEEVGENEEAQETGETDGENRPSENEEVIEVAIEMTLDEWKAIQEQSRPKVELNIRKPETPMPSKSAVIHKSKLLQKLQDDMDDVVFRRPANDITCQLEINFGSLARPSRGGRGGRGGRGRGTPPSTAFQKSPQKFEVAPNPDDPEDFPALG